MRWALLLLLAPLASAQLSLSVTNGTSESTVGLQYDFGRVAQGELKNVRFRIRTAGSTVVAVTTVSLSGSGFSVADRPSLPFNVIPGTFQEITVRFTAATPANYSATLAVNDIRLALTATSVPAPVISSGAGCTLAATSFDFGRIEAGGTKTCDAVVRNTSAQSMQITTVTVQGNGFGAPTGIRTPLTLSAGESVTVRIPFSPTARGQYSGTLTIETRMYTLTGVAFDPPLPTAIMEIDTAAESAKQPRLTLRLASAAPYDANGFVNLTIVPDTTLIGDDPAVMVLANGARTVPFMIRAGETQATISGQPSARFQTGTTAGRIRFAISGVAQGLTGGSEITFLIPPAPVAVDTATATRRAGFLDVSIVGFDNTYSAGSLGFTFLDRSGNRVEGGSVRADISSDFRAYFTSARLGSAFRLLITFPVNGDVTAIGSVEVEMGNSTGKPTRQTLLFP
jgi:hypothetical protein